MRTLYIHVGPAKTGTSAIQHALLTHDGSVVTYPQVGLSRGGSHNNLVLNFFSDKSRSDAVKADPRKLLDEIRRVFAASDRNVVISSEALFGRPGIRRFIEALTQQFSEPVAVKLIVVCREHFGRIASAYNQRVKDVGRFERDSPDDFLRRQNLNFGYAILVGKLRQMGKMVSVLNYHPPDKLVERFLRHIGFPDDQIPPSELRNVSLSSKALIAVLAANNVATSAEDRERYFTVLRKMRRFFGPSGFIFGREAALEASRCLQADRDLLESEYSIVLPARDLTAQDGGLYLNEGELAEISAVTGELGSEGKAIAEFASHFQRP